MPLPVDTLAKGLALDVRGHVVETVAGGAGIVQRQDVGMGEPRHDLDLAQEPLGTDRQGDLAVEDLERDLPAMLEIVREEDGRHAPAPQLAVEAIALGQGAREVFGSVGRHRVTLPQGRRNGWGRHQPRWAISSTSTRARPTST